MATIRLKFRSSSIEGKAGVLYYQIIHNRVVRQVSTDYSIPANQWDDKFQRVLHQGIRRKTQCDIDCFNRIIRQLNETMPCFTADDIVGTFKTNRLKNTLFNFMPTMVVDHRRMGSIKTAEGYQCALNSFSRFRKNEDITLDDITSTMMEEYQAWLKHNNIAPNTISFYMRKLRATYNRAVEEELIADKKPFKRVFTGTAKTKKRALPLTDLAKLNGVDLSANHAREFARDMFMMSLYLQGMAFVDLAFLKKSDLKGGVVTYRRHKTNQQIQVRWTAEMQRILDKYPSNSGKYLLPILPANCKDEWRAYTNRSHAINYHLKILGKQLGISINLTFYVCRHSWSTIARDNGVAVSVISEGLGHDSERTTRIYLASLDSSLIDNANSMIINLIMKASAGCHDVYSPPVRGCRLVCKGTKI
jgi:integrase